MGRLVGLRDSQKPHVDATGGEHVEILAALDRLTPAEREAIRLAVWEDPPVQDVAQVLGCSPNAASQRPRRARERLRADLLHLLDVDRRAVSPTQAGESLRNPADPAGLDVDRLMHDADPAAHGFDRAPAFPRPFRPPFRNRHLSVGAPSPSSPWR